MYERNWEGELLGMYFEKESRYMCYEVYNINTNQKREGRCGEG